MPFASRNTWRKLHSSCVEICLISSTQSASHQGHLAAPEPHWIARNEPPSIIALWAFCWWSSRQPINIGCTSAPLELKQSTAPEELHNNWPEQSLVAPPNPLLLTSLTKLPSKFSLRTQFGGHAQEEWSTEVAALPPWKQGSLKIANCNILEGRNWYTKPFF